MADQLQTDFAAAMERELDAVTNLADFCTGWKARWRGVAIAAQSILKIFYPPGAKVLGLLIAIADSYCANQ